MMYCISERQGDEQDAEEQGHVDQAQDGQEGRSRCKEEGFGRIIESTRPLRVALVACQPFPRGL